MSGNIVEAPRSQTAKELLRGIKVVDTDTHITEWADLWTSRATPKYRDVVPQMRTVDGKRSWTIGDHVIAGESAFAAIKKDGSKAPGLEFFDLRADEVTPGAFDVHARIRYMDQEGIAAQVGYTNLLGFGGPKAMKVDADLRLVSVQIQNDAMAEMQEESSHRVYPMAMVPWWDIDLAVKEVERCADMGLRGINTHGNPEFLGHPDLGETYWDPLWELCTDRALPVNFHIGFSQGQDKDKAEGWSSPGVFPSHLGYQKYVVSGAMLFAPNLQLIVNLLLTDIFERHPGLKFVSVESGVGWVPFMLEMLEYQIKENLPDMKERPIETFRKHFYACGWAEREGMLEYVRRIGADNVLFETDYPHPTCLHPHPLEYLRPMIEGLTPGERRKVFQTNAEALYKLDLSAAEAL